MFASKTGILPQRESNLLRAKSTVIVEAKCPGEPAVTCRNFRRCIHYLLGGYDCDHNGEHCEHFIERQAVADYQK